MTLLKLKIDVKAANIKNGRLLLAGGGTRCMYCPIALATNRTVRKATGVDVGLGLLRFTLNGLDYAGVLPQKARRFIERFDGDKRVKPFAFQVKAVAA